MICLGTNIFENIGEQRKSGQKKMRIFQQKGVSDCGSSDAAGRSWTVLLSTASLLFFR